MDDESGEFMETAELVCIGRSESQMERPARGCRREAGSLYELSVFDSRDKVRHSEKTDQLFIKMMLKADGKRLQYSSLQPASPLWELTCHMGSFHISFRDNCEYNRGEERTSNLLHPEKG